MKKINYKKILVTVLWFIALSGLTLSLAFVGKKEKHIRAEHMEIDVTDKENQFVNEEDIRNYFTARKDSILNNELSSINVNALEKALNAHPAVENADMSVDVNGDVKISITPRTPLVRILNMDGESYYLDTQSKLMPLSDKYTARVLVFNGYIYEPYARRCTFSAQQIGDNPVFSEVSMLDDIYKMARYITADSLLNSLVQQVSVNEHKEFELFPAVGEHKIIFGDVSDLEEKFNKLIVFYKDGLNATDNWNKYSAINLKYKNQVVCTKK